MRCYTSIANIPGLVKAVVREIQYSYLPAMRELPTGEFIESRTYTTGFLRFRVGTKDVWAYDMRRNYLHHSILEGDVFLTQFVTNVFPVIKIPAVDTQVQFPAGILHTGLAVGVLSKRPPLLQIDLGFPAIGEAIRLDEFPEPLPEEWNQVGTRSKILFQLLEQVGLSCSDCNSISPAFLLGRRTEIDFGIGNWVNICRCEHVEDNPTTFGNRDCPRCRARISRIKTIRPVVEGLTCSACGSSQLQIIYDADRLIRLPPDGTQ